MPRTGRKYRAARLAGVHDGAVPSQGHHHVARGDDFVRLLTGELLRFGGKQHLGAQLFQSSADAAQRLTAARRL